MPLRSLACCIFTEVGNGEFSGSNIDLDRTADNRDQWWFPYDSTERQKHIMEGYSDCDVYLLGWITYELLWPYWSTQANDNGVGRMLNTMRKYVVSSTLIDAPWKKSPG